MNNDLRIRSYKNLKYKLIKKMRERSMKFFNESKTKEEKEAWGMVICWLESFLSPCNREFTNNKAIGLRIDIREMSRIIDSS